MVEMGGIILKQTFCFLPLQTTHRFLLADYSPLGCSRCAGGLPRPKCQTAILLEVENFEALLELFRKNHRRTFAPFLWWIITGLGRSLGLTYVSGSSSPLLKKIMSFRTKTRLTTKLFWFRLRLCVPNMSCSVRIWEYMPLWSNFQKCSKNANIDQQDS